MAITDLGGVIVTRQASILLAALVLGCAVPTTGVVPQGSGVLTVTRQGSSFLVQTAELRSAALKEAGEHCELKKRPLRVIHVKETPAGVLGRWPEAEVVFECQ